MPLSKQAKALYESVLEQAPEYKYLPYLDELFPE